jgi:hypothetical protein
MTEMNALPVAAGVPPPTEHDPDATWVAFLLSRGSPERARDFARAMTERTAWHVEGNWHDHWKRVAALLGDATR